MFCAEKRKNYSDFHNYSHKNSDYFVILLVIYTDMVMNMGNYHKNSEENDTNSLLYFTLNIL